MKYCEDGVIWGLGWGVDGGYFINYIILFYIFHSSPSLGRQLDNVFSCWVGRISLAPRIPGINSSVGTMTQMKS